MVAPERLVCQRMQAVEGDVAVAVVESPDRAPRDREAGEHDRLRASQRKLASAGPWDDADATGMRKLMLMVCLCDQACWRDNARRAPRRIASIIDDTSALPVPAMSYAVPWSTLVRTMGSPAV